MLRSITTRCISQCLCWRNKTLHNSLPIAFASSRLLRHLLVTHINWYKLYELPYFIRVQWRGLLHGDKPYCAVTGLTARWRGLLHGDESCCMISITAWWRVLLHGDKPYCTVTSLTALWRILLQGDESYFTVTSLTETSLTARWRVLLHCDESYCKVTSLTAR